MIKLHTRTEKLRQAASKSYSRLKKEVSKRANLKTMVGYISFLLVAVVIALLLLMLVKVRTESFELGYRIALLEKEKTLLREEVDMLLSEWTRLSSREHLIELNKRMNLNLLPPAEWIERKE